MTAAASVQQGTVANDEIKQQDANMDHPHDQANPFAGYSPRTLRKMDTETYAADGSTLLEAAAEAEVGVGEDKENIVKNSAAPPATLVSRSPKEEVSLFMVQPASDFVQPVSASRLKLFQSFEDFNADRAEVLHSKSVLNCFLEGGCRMVEQKRISEGTTPWEPRFGSGYYQPKPKLSEAALSSRSWIFGRSGGSLSPRSTRVRGFGGPYGMWYHERAALEGKDVAEQEAVPAEAAPPAPAAPEEEASPAAKKAEALAAKLKVVTVEEPEGQKGDTKEKKQFASVMDDLVMPDKGVMSPLQKVRAPIPEMYSYKDPADRPMLVNPSVETLAHIGTRMPILTQDNIDMKFLRSRVVANVHRNHEIIREMQRTDKREQRVLRLYTDVVKRSDRDDAAAGQRKDRFGFMGESKRHKVQEASRAAHISIRKNLSQATGTLDASVKELERIKRRDEIAKRKASGQKEEDKEEKGFGQLMSFFA
ncbi:unnamed protein product [Amoebophrya sp. A120]|nr:unnamed protein product [Amoebophrya sp. A120]|eukprot:GSA120T00018554001.1